MSNKHLNGYVDENDDDIYPETHYPIRQRRGRGRGGNNGVRLLRRAAVSRAEGASRTARKEHRKVKVEHKRDTRLLHRTQHQGR